MTNANLHQGLGCVTALVSLALLVCVVGWIGL